MLSVSAGRIVLVLLAAAVVYLAGNASVSLWDRDEPRYAQCSRQMLESGDWVVPRLYDDIRAAKPPLIYWLQASSMKLFGADNAFAPRLPSALAMLGTLSLLAIALSRHVGAEKALWTVFIFASSVLTIVSAKVCLTDSVLVLFTTIAQFGLYALWRGSRSWTVVGMMAVALALGGLTKGPFILGIVGCTAAALAIFGLFARVIRRTKNPQAGKVAPAREMETASILAGEENAGNSEPMQTEHRPMARLPSRRPLLLSIAQMLVAITIITVIVAPWLILVNHRSPEFLHRSTVEARAHLEQGKEGHHLPPGYHFVMVWPMFMPWSLLLPLSIGVGIRQRRQPEVRFALAAVVGPWVMVEFLGTKLPHYFLAAYPALAFLTAGAVLHCIRGKRSDMESRPFLVGVGAWSAIVAVVGCLPCLLVRYYRPLPWGAMALLSAGGIAYGGAVFSLFRARRSAHALAAMGLGMMASVVLACTLYFPNAEFLRTSIRMAAALRRLGAIHPGDVYMIDYKEPSLGFYQGGTIRERTKPFLQPKMIDEWPRWMVVTQEAWNGAAPESKARLRIMPGTSVKGWAYADGGRFVELMVVEKTSGISIAPAH